jgi:DNA-binding response OmpR family regulator
MAAILMVEDRPELRTLMRIALERQGHVVLSASNGAEALALAHRHRLGIDLALVDLFLSDMEGSDLAGQLLRLCPGGSVIYVAGSLAGEDPLKTLSAEGELVLLKPFTVKELLDAVELTLA